MALHPKDMLNKNKNLNRLIETEKINLDNITIKDLNFNGKNYDKYVNLNSLLNSVSSCQISDACGEVLKRPCTINDLKAINNQKIWGRIYTCQTSSDDWGTITLAIDEASQGDVLFIKVDGSDAAIWGELASRCASSQKIKGTAVWGNVRDVDALMNIDYPIFACGFCPNAGSPLGLGTLGLPVDIEGFEISSGDFFFGDESGVVVVPQNMFAKVMNASLFVKLKEEKIVKNIDDGMSLSEIVDLK